ncbi:penicillin-binding protein [Patescibacteria group bacterium]|nr:penicillin-binding protein [Patescibacteria group bacterium]
MKMKLQIFFRPMFKGLYFIALFFIIIGQTVRKPFEFFFQIVISLSKKVSLPKIGIKKQNFTPFKAPKLILPKIKLPTLKLPKIIFPKKSFCFVNERIRFFILGVATTFVLMAFYQSYLFIKELPSPGSIGKVNYPLSTHIYDRNGVLLYEIFRDQNRTQISLKDLPKYVVQATISIEDKDFYKHNGVNLIGGILRAVKESLLNKQIQGGSTITQQLVKSALLTPERTIERKIKEVILALWTEKVYSKDKILEMYLNQVPYGGSSYGIEEAAKTYFGKSAKDLTIAEVALLAGLPQAPSIYSPYTNPVAAIRRRNEVLEAMAKQKYISEEVKEKNQKLKLDVIPPKTSISAPHFVFYTKSQLESYFGTEKVEKGGLEVITTLDLDVQREVEKILAEEIEKISYLNVTNGAVLVTRPSTGEILAMAGSVDYFIQPWGAFNVTTALRQPGSSIKPIMYSLGLQKNYTAASIIDDRPTSFRIEGSSPYQPVNYDGRFHGKVPLRYALANSYNIPAVKVLENIGVGNFIDFAQKLGISTWKDKSRYGLSLTLGGGEVKMTDMAEAFGVLANLGYKTPLNYYLKIGNTQGDIIREARPFKIREMDPGVAYIISDILSDNFARTWAFGSGTSLEVPGYKVAVKTGTTDSKKDNWTIGYTPDFLVVVWVGNNDNTPMNPYLSSGITGAAPIWNRVMSYLLKNYTSGSRWYEKPENIVEKNCFFGRKEYFIKGTENKINCGTSMLASPTPTP